MVTGMTGSALREDRAFSTGQEVEARPCSAQYFLPGISSLASFGPRAVAGFFKLAGSCAPVKPLDFWAQKIVPSAQIYRRDKAKASPTPKRASGNAALFDEFVQRDRRIGVLQCRSLWNVVLSLDHT